MITTFCQYSYGVYGFRVYHIDLIPNALLDDSAEEQANDNNVLPSQARIFFWHGGVKLALLEIPGGRHCLAVREIPSLRKDDSGRDICCVAMFIGDSSEDYRTLRNLALSIADDLSAFEKFFANLFFVRQGLRFDGDALARYIQDNSADYNYSGTSPLLQVPTLPTNGVQLFVPLSDSFSERRVREKLLSEMQLSSLDVREAVVLPYRELLSVQGRLTREIAAASHADNGSAEDKNPEDIVVAVPEPKFWDRMWIGLFGFIDRILRHPLSEEKKGKIKTILITVVITVIVTVVFMLLILNHPAKNA